MDNGGSITRVGGEKMGCVDGSKCAGLGVTVVCGSVLLVVSFVEGCLGVGVVGSLGVIRAIRGWTWSIIMGWVGVRSLWLCRGGNIQVLQ